ncbi:alcohol dehydrogenase AdhP [Paenibacillus motobuensis]|uniref:alcohol dehydrogenase AdhP n=1 Tax=Paenibacillus TaxID=44249 RepID=UPI00203E3583|nr:MULTISPECIES: alcohol dehydrogenase AdhP [Paenibacillus]MCM3039619.1 alcohol dehydrogenase AdhP [Paenibacillus lutimineralis]MCM3646723.1 alcohol dehydrogenase AdhP [Paenibacillus motobuensis]
MKAAVVHEFHSPLQIEEVDKPVPGLHQALVRIKACGVCHTDLHAAHGDWPVKPKLPLIPGHEGVGVVETVGEGVEHIKPGDRVGIPWLYSACGHCEYCLTGRETLCKEQHNAGYSVDGSYADYCLADAGYVVKIPDNIDFIEAAPLFCAGVTTYKAIKVSDTKPGDWVAVFGIGGLGHLAVQYAKAMGLNVIAVDTVDEKLELAKKLGAEHTVNPTQEDAADAIQRDIGGAHASICTAVSKAAFDQAYRCVRRGGTCVAVGLPPEKMEIPIFDTVLNGVKIVGSIVGSRRDLQETLQFAAEGKVKAITETRKLEEINDIFDEMEKGDIYGRVVMDMSHHH